MESDLVKQGLQEAEKQWTTLGSCAGPTVGSTPNGAWVSPNALSLCREEYFFSRTGRLLAKTSCCEAECQEWGFGLRMKAGPVTRDLCGEAKASLILLGVTAQGANITNIVGTDGVAATTRPAGHWALPFGHYSVEYSDGGQQPLDVLLGSDGGIASPVSAPELEIGLLFHRPGASE